MQKNKSQIQKTIYSREYAVVLRLLKAARKESGVTQVQLAERLGQTQSFVSKVERGESRLDIVQLRTILHEFGVTLPQFSERMERELAKRS